MKEVIFEIEVDSLKERISKELKREIFRSNENTLHRFEQNPIQHSTPSTIDFHNVIRSWWIEFPAWRERPSCPQTPLINSSPSQKEEDDRKIEGIPYPRGVHSPLNSIHALNWYLKRLSFIAELFRETARSGGCCTQILFPSFFPLGVQAHQLVLVHVLRSDGLEWDASVRQQFDSTFKSERKKLFRPSKRIHEKNQSCTSSRGVVHLSMKFFSKLSSSSHFKLA